MADRSRRQRQRVFDVDFVDFESDGSDFDVPAVEESSDEEYVASGSDDSETGG